MTNTATDYHLCCNPACTSGKSATLQCPTCKAEGWPQSWFCGKECFQRVWSLHSILHQFNDPAKWNSFEYTGPTQHAYISQKLSVPQEIRRPEYVDTAGGRSPSEDRLRFSTKIDVKNAEEVEQMREAGRAARAALDAGKAAARIGATTDEIDRAVHDCCVEEWQCYPSPLGYYGFPKSCCISLNEVVCHGIPDARELVAGDLCNVDVSVFTRDGMHGDCNETVFVGGTAPNDEAQRLWDTTRSCLRDAIEFVRPGKMYRDLGEIIARRAKRAGFERGIVRDFGGHGIGKLFHTTPQIPHYSKNKAVGVMRPGHTFCLEPMINGGSSRVKMWPDDWTAATADGSLSVQFEHMILVTNEGFEVLTASENDDVVMTAPR